MSILEIIQLVFLTIFSLLGVYLCVYVLLIYPSIALSLIADKLKIKHQASIAKVGCGLLFIVVTIATIISTKNNFYESKRKRFVKDSIQHVQDSLAHDPRYQDSIRLEQIHFKDYILDNTFFLMYFDDSVYHTSTECVSWNGRGRDSLVIVTLRETIEGGYRRCEDCEEKDDIYSDY